MTMQVRIIDFNYPFQSNVSLSASSANDDFPVSNLASPLRAKTWRSSGNFVINSTNNKINFKKVDGGPELTATVASATYTPTTLAAAIKAALEAADGVNTYTVSYSALTGKWTIASSGAFLSILWNTGTNTATSTGPSIGFPVSADSTGAVTYTGSNIALHTEEWIVIDTKTTDGIDSFAMLFDPMAGNNFSESATFTLQGNATNSWSAPSVSQSVSVDDDFDALNYFFSSTQSYRYWRLKIVDPANANLYVEVSKLILGLATQLTQLPSNGISNGLVDQSQVSRNQYGHEYVDIYPPRRTIGLPYSALGSADFKTLDKIYRRVGLITPMLIAVDPLVDTFNANQNMVYGKFSQPFSASHRISSFFDTQVEFTEVM